MRVQKHVLHPQFNILYPLNNKNKVQGGRYSQIHRLCGHLHFSCVQQHNVQKDWVKLNMSICYNKLHWFHSIITKVNVYPIENIVGMRPEYWVCCIVLGWELVAARSEGVDVSFVVIPSWVLFTSEAKWTGTLTDMIDVTLAVMWELHWTVEDLREQSTQCTIDWCSNPHLWLGWGGPFHSAWVYDKDALWASSFGDYLGTFNWENTLGELFISSDLRTSWKRDVCMLAPWPMPGIGLNGPGLAENRW